MICTHFGRTYDTSHPSCKSCIKQGLGCVPQEEPVKQHKYRAQKVTIDGITFDSKKEGARYQQLKLMEKAGKVSDLTLQPTFELAPSVTIAGKKKRALTYRADFRYVEDGVEVVEDCKGFLTDVYVLKRHLMKAIHGIDIFES